MITNHHMHFPTCCLAIMGSMTSAICLDNLFHLSSFSLWHCCSTRMNISNTYNIHVTAKKVRQDKRLACLQSLNSFVSIPDGIAQVWAAWRPPLLSAYPALCLHLLCLSPSTQTGRGLLAAGPGWLWMTGEKNCYFDSKSVVTSENKRLSFWGCVIMK